MKYMILLLTLASLIAFSCKTGKATSEKVKGKWQLVEYLVNAQNLNTAYNESHKGKSSDIMDFRKDGNIHGISTTGKDYLLPYKVEGDSILLMGSERYTITNLTNSSMKLYQRKLDKYTPTAFAETSYIFKK